MKNLVNLTLEVLSSEELLAVRGGDAPIHVIIIKENPGLNLLNALSVFTVPPGHNGHHNH